MSQQQTLRSLCASIARTSSRNRFESASRLLALKSSEITSQIDLSPPAPSLATSTLAQLFANDLVVTIDFCSTSIIGQILRAYDPHVVAFHHVLASALVHTWSHALAMPTSKSASTPRRTSLNTTLAAAPTCGSFFARLIIVASIAESEPLALQTVSEFQDTASTILAHLRRAPFVLNPPADSSTLLAPRPPTLAQLDDCDKWLGDSCRLLQNRLRFSFTGDVSHDMMMHRAFIEGKEAKLNRMIRNVAKQESQSPPKKR